MNEINNEQIKSILFEVSKEFILPKFKNLKSEEIQFKNNKDLVTEVDLAVEEKLNNILCSLLPNSLFVGEEKFSLNSKIFDCYKQNQYCWTVDPIDGTTNFVNGKEKFAIMVALTFSDQIIQSWIYKPLTEEICSALLGEGIIPSMMCADIFVKNLGDNESYEKEVDEYFKIYGKVFNFIRTKLHNKFNLLRMMPDLLSIFRYMKKNEERFGMEINMRDLMKVAKA